MMLRPGIVKPASGGGGGDIFVAASTSTSYTLPAGTSAGNLLLVFVNSRGWADLTTMAANGWTYAQHTDGGSDQMLFAQKVATSGDVTAGSVSGQGLPSHTGGPSSPVVLAYRSATSASVKQWLDVASGDTFSFSAFSPAVNSAGAVAFGYMGDTGAPAQAASTGWTARASVDTSLGHLQVEDKLTYSGGTFTWQWSGWDPACGCVVELLT